MADRELNVANAFNTTLTSQMGALDTTANVETTSGAPSSPCILCIDPGDDDKREYILFDGTFTSTQFVTSSTTNRFLTGSAAPSGLTHEAGAVVRMVVSAQLLEDLHDRIDADQADFDTHVADTANPHSVTGAQAGVDKAYVDALNVDADTVDGQDSTDLLARANHTGSQASTTISDFTEAVQDVAGAFATDGTTINFTYDDVANTLTAEVQNLDSTYISDFAEAVDDQVNALVVGGTGITVTYDDVNGTLTIAFTDDMATQAELDAHDGAGGTAHADVTTTVDGFMIAADKVKLDGIETGADVTDETNVTDALDGATLTVATVATDDKVLIQDTDGTDVLKTVTAQSIADLGGGGGTDWIWLGPGDFHIVSGAPAESTVNTLWPAWLYDSANEEGVATTIRLPDSWSTFNVDYWWTNASTGTGDVSWVFITQERGDGETLGWSLVGPTAFTAPGQNVVEVSTVVSGRSYTAGEMLLVCAYRDGNEAADTLGNDAALLGVRLSKAS